MQCIRYWDSYIPVRSMDVWESTLQLGQDLQLSTWDGVALVKIIFGPNRLTLSLCLPLRIASLAA